MELNTKGRYAVMAMADLAKHGADQPVPLSAIAERQQLSLPYLEQIFMQLRRAGLVDSARGRSGGYRLGRTADTIPVSDIMRAVAEETRITRCTAGEQGCMGGTAHCITHGLWSALGEEIDAFLDRVTLSEVLTGIPTEKRPQKLAVKGVAAE